MRSKKTQPYEKWNIEHLPSVYNKRQISEQLPLYDMQPKEPTTDDVRRKSRDARMNPNLKTIRFQTPRNELTLKNTN